MIVVSSTRPPLADVRRTLRVKWYRSPIDPGLLRQLMKRSDLQGWWQALGVIGYLTGTALLTWHFFAQQQWALFAVALFAYGTYSCFLGAASHELDHGTVFRTKALNRFFLRLFSLITFFNPDDYALSHTYHHRYTLHPEGDREVVLPQSAAVRVLFIVQLFCVNLTGGPGCDGLIPRVRDTVNAALGKPRAKDAAGDTEPLAPGAHEWIAALYEAHPEERIKSVRWARKILLFHAAVIAVAIVFQLWLLPVFITLSRFLMNWWRLFVFLPMHCGLRDNVADFRKCTRSIRLDPVSSFMYWRMNWHLEHHMYAGVPCYNLRKLRQAIEFDLPVANNAIAAFREMRATWKRQQIGARLPVRHAAAAHRQPGPHRRPCFDAGRRPQHLDWRPGPGRTRTLTGRPGESAASPM